MEWDTEYYVNGSLQIALFPASMCTCPKECTCQCPEPTLGVALVSNDCPIHNDWPDPNGMCIVHGGE